jgi:FixJ family two-component response regulator
VTAGTVYVIDDDASVRRATGRLLETSGCTVVLCESATEFLSLPSIDRPTCLVLDISMPGLTGFDLQEALYASGRCLPIIFVTGIADETVAERAQAVGATFFLKPVSQADLLAAVRKGLAADSAWLSLPPTQVTA